MTNNATNLDWRAMTTPEKLIADLSTALRLDHQLNPHDGMYYFEAAGQRENPQPLASEKIASLAESLARHPLQGTWRSTGDSYEMLVADESRTGRPVSRLTWKLEDSERGLTYELGEPSDELIIGLLDAFSPSVNQENHSRIRRAAVPVFGRDSDVASVLDLARRLFRRYASLQITADKSRSVAQFKKYANSFTFHAAYNLDLMLSGVPLETVLPRLRGRIGMRTDADEVDAPRLSYDEELVSRYIAATASSDAVSRYLGYYHVLEGQFEPLYNDFLVGEVRKTLTAPAFSMKRNSDISGLVKQVSRLVRERQNEAAGIDEKRALRLTLERHVSLDSLVQRLNSAEYIQYVRDSTVSFSGGDSANLLGPTQEALDRLTARIYKTRNAVVHAKTTEENRFRPRRDAGELEKETLLMRALAEEIIVNLGRILE